jgi:hypothetical protein
MSNRPEDTHTHAAAKHPLVMRVTDNDFQCEVLEKLARLEAKDGHAGRRRTARADDSCRGEDLKS